MPDSKNFYGQPLKIFDFKKGLWTVDPALLIPAGATPNCQNVWYDEEGALSKMPGTSELLNSVESYNQFMRNPPWETFTYKTVVGAEKLIIQGMDTGNTTMKLWALDKQRYYPANLDPTDITPDSGLVTYRRCCFVVYRGRLYLFNGADNFKFWNGEEWTEYHSGEDEHFRFGCVYDDCIFAARSGNNPTRVIYTEQNECYFGDYYSDGTHWRDFPVTKGGPITGILATPMGTLMVFGKDWIQELSGSPVNDTDSRHAISVDKGAIDHWSIGVIGERIIFAWIDGLYVTGNTGVIVSAEDQKLKTEARVTNVTSEIRNYWKENFILPDPMETREKAWSGYSDFSETLVFKEGESEILPYEIIIGASSDATARVLVVDATGGTWAGTAVGNLYITDVSGGPFTANEDINVGSVKHAVVTSANSGWTLATCVVNKAPVTDNPVVINFDSTYNLHDNPTNQSTTDTKWVDLRSDIGKNQFYSQGIKMLYDPAPGAGVDIAICRGMAIYLKETGDFSGDTLDVYVTVESKSRPDFNKVYTEGKLDGDFLHGVVELEFDSGSEEPLEGAKIELNGDVANTYGTIERVYLKNGRWSDGSASGYFYIKTEGGSATWVDNGQIDINGGTANIATVDEPSVGDSSPISTGCWVFCEMNYWDYPQNMFDGDYDSPPQIYVAIKSSDDTDSNYISWNYKDGNPYADGQMVNSDSENPDTQSDLDYCFRYYGHYLDTTATVSSTSYQAEGDLDHWGNINVILDEATLGDYTRNSILEKIEYEVQSADSGWGSWTETENGGEITGSGRWLRWKLTFSRATGTVIKKMDSFTMREIRVSYITENTSDLLVSSETKDDRYWFSSKMNTIDGDCLYYDGGDNVWIPDSDTLDMGTGDFAVEFWIKGATADQAASWSPIIGDWAGYYSVTGDHGWNLSIVKSGGKLRYHIDSAATCDTMTASPDLLDGDPHYVAVNFDRDGEATAWVDNVEIGGTYDISAASASDLSNDLPFLIGGSALRLNVGDDWEPAIWYTGKLRQLRLYKGRLLTTTEIAYNYANPSECQDTSNLVGWWKCMEGQGDTIGDYSESANVGVRGNGVPQNKPAWTYWDESTGVALYGGMLMMDRNGAIFPRTGQNILKVSTMVNFDNKLVMGVGVDGTSYPNLVYLDKTKSTEVGILGTGSSATIVSNWDSKVYCTETLSKVTRLEVVYYNDSSYESGSGSGFNIQYRKDEAVDDDNVPTFTTLKSVELSATVTDRNKHQYMNIDTELEKEGKMWQFRILSNNKFKVLWFKPWIEPQPLTQD